MKVRLDHIYFSVKNMDRAIKFYESLLSCKVKHREANIWADFDIGKGVYLIFK